MMNSFLRLVGAMALAFTMLWSAMTLAAPNFPEPTDPSFCQVAQQYLSNTERVSYNTMFENMPDYRASKPVPRPLMTFQVVTYRGQQPIVVSCKVKGAAHIRAVSGDDSAGEQLFCPSITALMVEAAAAELDAEGKQGAANAARAFVIEQNEPYLTGRDYLSDFPLSFVGEDKAVHINTPGLFHDFDSWTSWILPKNFEGQVYCHLPTKSYLKSLAAGEIEPGTEITTADDAPTVPSS